VSNADWNFYGNTSAVEALAGMIVRDRIPQTILLAGPEGVGKATLARRFAAHLLGYDQHKIEQDDLSLDSNVELRTERLKLTAEKRNDDPLVFGSHPDFLTFTTDGPLDQISIQQMRLIKERAPMKPLRGNWRVFLIDGMDRANTQAANSLLKTLEEPPSHLVLIMTARNAYDLLPTIRSRSVTLNLGRLGGEDMRTFIRARGLDQPERRLAMAEGAPGVAVSVDFETYDRRRTAMLTLLRVAAGLEQFGAWMKHSDSIAARKTEKLEQYLEVLYSLLEDTLRLLHGAAAKRNADIQPDLETLSTRVSFEWIRRITIRVDELVELARRNIQKSIALDAIAAGGLRHR
jgi:DNA polymerase-3 subunit delta'